MKDLNSLNPDRIIIAGDWHGQADHAVVAVRTAHELGVEVILHVGDFGWNRKADAHEHFNQPLEEALQEFGVTILWVDGNWENHTLLRELPVRDDGFVQTGDSGLLYWVPRGHRWEWQNKAFAGLGGAYSVRTAERVAGFDWFPELEEVKPADVARLGNSPVDVLLTHEVPLGVPVIAPFSLPPEITERATLGRALVRAAVESTTPQFVFSGHWHQRVTHEEQFGGRITSFNVLNREWEPGNLVLLDVAADQMVLEELPSPAPSLAFV